MKIKILILALILSLQGIAQDDMFFVLASQGAANLKTDLVSVWELNETGGSTAEDEHSINDGTLFNTPTLNQTGVTNLTPAYSFAAGSSEYVEEDAGIVTGYPISFSTWVNTTTTVNGSQIFFLGDKDVDDMSVGLQWRDDGGTDQGVTLYVFNVSIDWVYSDVTTNDGNWHHIVGVLENSTSRTIYVDGTVANTSTTSLACPAIDRWAIGRLARSSPGSYLTGTVDQTAVWERALIQDDVDDLYNSGNGRSYSNW